MIILKLSRFSLNLLLLFTVMLSVQFTVPALASSKADIVVDAEGEAAIIAGGKTRAREEAKRNAYRDALEKGMGAYVEGITEMKDFQVVKDQVFSQAKGIVKNFKVLKEWADDDNIYHIKARCSVAMKSLDNVLGPVVIDALGNPRVMVVISEKVNNKDVSMFTVENEVVRTFHNAGYFMIDKDQCDSITAKKLNAARLAGDQQALLDLAQSFNADVLIYGKSEALLNPPLSVGGRKVYKANGQLQLKAVNAQTAQLIDIQTPKAIKNGVSKNGAIEKALSSASDRASKAMIYKIAYGLVSGNMGGRTVHLIVKDISFSGARKLKSALGEMSGVVSSYQRSYRNKKLELDVNTEGNAEDLAIRLEELGLEIETVTSATVEATSQVK